MNTDNNTKPISEVMKEWEKMTTQEQFELWKTASDYYYNGNETLMTDAEFDNLTLVLSNSDNEEIVKFVTSKLINSDSKWFSAENSNEGQQVSLYKIKFKNKSSYSEIVGFFKNAPNIQFWISPKYDGCSIRITRNNDSYTITTRGGNDVTEKLETNKYIQNAIKAYQQKYICGELLIEKQIFRDKYSDDYQNGRNFVAGYLNSKDIDSLKICNDLVFVPYTDGTNPLSEKWELLSNVKPTSITLANRNLEAYYNYLKSDKFPFMCDGIVIGYYTDRREIKENYPLNMVAVKFPSEVKESTVIGIEWSEKKLGNLIPIVNITPIEFDGSIISKCSGYNYQYLQDNHIGIGSRVEITKSGDIIPIIVKTITKSDIINIPDNVYECGKHLRKFNNNEVIKNKFSLGIQSFEIKGIGDVQAKEIGKLINYDIIELFNPNNDTKYLTGLSNKPALYNLVLKLLSIKQIQLSDLIYALQFDNVGKTISKKISLLLTRQSTDDTNISNYIKDNVLRGEGFLKIKDAMNTLKTYGVKIILDSENDECITFEMTGNPPGMTKDEFVALVVKKQQEIYKGNPKFSHCKHTSLTKTTTFLVTDKMISNSSKMQKARKYNINIVTYNQILSDGFKCS